MGGRKGIGHTERMGSARSSGGARLKLKPVEDEPEKEPPKLDEDGNLTNEEVAKRVTKSRVVSTVKLGDRKNKTDGITVQYAFVTQRGYYPDDVHKENQDSYSITLNFAGQDGDALFGVYDGHGPYGDKCAQFAKKELPKALAKEIRALRIKKHKGMVNAGKASNEGGFKPSNWPLLSEEEYEGACMRAHNACNAAMRKDDKVDDTLSGTTAIICAFHAGWMTICNIGDSRAVLGHRLWGKKRRAAAQAAQSSRNEEEKTEIDALPEAGDVMPTAEPSAEGTDDCADEKKEDGWKDDESSPEDDGEGKLTAFPLSRDQTPYRRDERERVKECGARVMSIDQMEGIKPMHENWGDKVLGEDIDEVGDPPRIWFQNGDYPGTAFTRSLGDSMASTIGVCSDPEMMTREMSGRDEILVLASDGVFEFVSNQDAIDICAGCNDPLEAGEKLVRGSYDQWLRYELRTDDITAIVMFLECDRPLSDSKSKMRELMELAEKCGNKPIKSTLSTESSGSNGGKDPQAVEPSQ